jgi:hypothetical protein
LVMMGKPEYNCMASPLMTSPLYLRAKDTASWLRWSVCEV